MKVASPFILACTCCTSSYLIFDGGGRQHFGMLILMVELVVTASPLGAFYVDGTGFAPTQANKDMMSLVIAFLILFFIAFVYSAANGTMCSQWSSSCWPCLTGPFVELERTAYGELDVGRRSYRTLCSLALMRTSPIEFALIFIGNRFVVLPSVGVRFLTMDAIAG